MQSGGWRAALIWFGVVAAMAVPVGIAAASPLLQWREAVYIAAGLAGVSGLAILLLQPLLIGGHLPGIDGAKRARLHVLTGGLLVFLVLVHVAGLYVTSPPDVVDALLFRSPTLFSPFGVVVMWSVFLAALIAGLRRKLGLPVILWRAVHTVLAIIIVIGTVVHALLIEGTMGTVSKTILCILVVSAAGKVIVDRRVFPQIVRRSRS